MIDTHNEDPDTYRFKAYCEKWYDQEIEVISAIPDKYSSIQDVWLKAKSLNTATGAICSTNLKRVVREQFQKSTEFDYQVFGFEFEKKEFNRAIAMKLNHPDSKPIFPLLMFGYNKKDCIDVVQQAGIQVPVTYKLGLKNNNCFQTGCVQGGIGYWQHMKRIAPDKFQKMAEMEHKLTDLKGQPVTMLKDQSNAAKQLVKDSGIKWKQFVFLLPHPDYPELKSLKDMPEMKVEPLFECNGFCGVNDLIERKQSEQDINLD